MFEIIFLGTGGGRFAMITQKRRTGGLRILSEKINLHVDPGPGALVYSLEAGLDPQQLDAILISHSHPDHANDAEILIEAMSRGTIKKRGILAAAHSVLKGNDICEQSISNYHQKIPEKTIDARVGTSFNIEDDAYIQVCKAKHSDPDTIGFRFKTKDSGDFAYIPDSEYFEGISKCYSNSRLLIISVLRPSGNPWRGHMTTDDAARVVNEIRPEIAIITHFGMQIILRTPEHEAESIEKKTGVTTKAAADGMRIFFGKNITVGKFDK